MSNLDELLSILRGAEHEFQTNTVVSPHGRRRSQSEMELLVNKTKNDIEYMALDTFHNWMKCAKAKLTKLIVPAVLESQSLPGLQTEEGGFFKAIMGTTPTANIDDLLVFFDKVRKPLIAYMLNEALARQAIVELMSMVGILAFNNMLMR